MLIVNNCSAHSRNFCRAHQDTGRSGWTLAELMVSLVAMAIIIAGLYLFLSKNLRFTSEKDSERRLALKVNIIQQALEHEFDQIGINPMKVPFQFDVPPALAAEYRDCQTFPLFDVTETTRIQ